MMVATQFEQTLFEQAGAAGQEDPGAVRELTEPPPFYQASDRSLDALKPPPREDPREWVPGNVFFPAISSAVPRPYDFYMFPYHRGVWDAFCDPSINTITLMWATQLGKTALMTAMLCYKAAQDPSPVIWGGPDERLVKRSFERKLYPVLKATPQCSRLLPPEHLQRIDEIDLTNMVVYAGPSGSVTALGDISAQTIFKNELDKWSTRVSTEGDPASLIDERRKAFRRFKIINESTPSEQDSSRINAAYEASDKRTFHVPCPHCGEYQELIFEKLVMPHDDQGRLADPARCAAESYYPCDHCGDVIADHHKVPAMQRGRWVRAGERVEPDGSLTVDDPELLVAGNHAGFQLSSLYSPALTFGDVAREWSAAQNDLGKLKNFVNGWLARVFAPKTRVTSIDQVLKHRYLDDNLGYARDTCPRVPIACLLAVDVQEDCLWYSVWAWAEGRRQYLVRYGQLPEELDTILEVARVYYECSADGGRFRASHALIDSGYRTQEVYRFCAQYSGFTPIKGLASSARAQSVSWSRQGEKGADEAVDLLTINVHPFKDMLADLIRKSNPDDPGCWRLPASCGRDFAEQLTAEKRITKRDQYNRATTMWVNVKGRPNHYWDTCVINLAGAEALSLQGSIQFNPPPPPNTVPPPPKAGAEGIEKPL
jgi:phage terminase large subunit GpA-like protein